MDPRVSFFEGSDRGQVQTIQVITNQIETQYKTLVDLLQPIPDASYTRDRRVSPPDSACLPGTRKVVIKAIFTWFSSTVLFQRKHIFYLYGYAGSGKSAIAQEICEQVHGFSRLLGSFFFFRNAGDRSQIEKLPETLASQLAMALPQTAPFIRAAIDGDPELVSAQSKLALGARLQALVYGPFKAVVERGSLSQNPLSYPYLIVIDGLDECEDKKGVQDFLDCTLRFFRQKPSIPLRVVITSRVEQHIHSCLNDGGVRFKDLADHCSRDDIIAFMRDVFDKHIKGDPVIQAYIRQNGPWPTQSDASKLVDHIGGSFIFASTLFKFIFHGSGSHDDHSTPMSRLPLTLNINPGLDALYSTTLARSENLPHFVEVISTLALTNDPLPVSGIAELLGLSPFEVVLVLRDLQAIIQLPGTDDAPVMFCHTSLSDFLTTKERAGRFHASPEFHLRLFLQCFIMALKDRRQGPLQRLRQTPAVAYSLKYEDSHWTRGEDAFKSQTARTRIDKLCRKARRRPPSSETHASYLDKLGLALLEMVNNMEATFHIGGIASLHREALRLRPSSDDARLATLDNLGIALCKLFEDTGTTPAVNEAICHFRETRSLRQSPHPHLSMSLSNLGNALYMLFQQDGCIDHIVEAISTHREALELRPSPHPGRHMSLNHLGNALHALCEHDRTIPRVEEAITLYREALTLQLQDRSSTLTNLGDALRLRGEHSGQISDHDEAVSLLRKALELLEQRPRIESRWPRMHIGIALYFRFRTSRSTEDLDEAISSLRESLHLIPPLHICRHTPLRYLVMSLQALHERDQSLTSLKEAITHARELLTRHYTSGHRHRGEWLDRMISLLRMHVDATGCRDHLDEAIKFDEELENIVPSSG